MRTGEPSLHTLYSSSKKNKTFAKHELDEIENALENVRPFIDYKLAEMNNKK